MTSFRSHFFPKNKNAFLLLQEHAMRNYAIFTIFVMAGVLVKVYAAQNVLWFALIGEFGAILLANMMAYVSLRRRYAQISFLNEHLSLISVHDILYEEEPNPFPLKYANPQRRNDEISIHYHDQIIVLRKEHWEDFELIWEWLNAEPNSQFYSTFS